MKEKKYLIITFSQTVMALYTERVCREDGMEGRIIPLPKSIDAGCGLVWASENRDRDMWEGYMKGKNIDYQEITEVLI